MAKPGRDAVQNGLNGWDSTVNNNFIKLFDKPFPIYLHTGDETDLQTTFPAASHEECLVIVDHTTLGLVPYIVDQNHPSGSATWVLFGTRAEKVTVTAVTGTTTLGPNDKMMTLAAGTYTVTLDSAADLAGETIRFKFIGASGTVTLDGEGTETIDGSLTYAMSTQYEFVNLYSDGTNWHVVGKG